MSFYDVFSSCIQWKWIRAVRFWLAISMVVALWETVIWFKRAYCAVSRKEKP
jgi:hypothetical protein